MKCNNRVGIYLVKTIQSMFKKILGKLKLGCCTTKSADDVNAFKESETKTEEKSK
ncbi:MAG: hypothetical protein ACW9W4_07070 [Candidatus Nitrosopumilus sp. bin_7KS]